MSWSSGLTGQTGQPGQTGQTGQTDLTIKLDFSGNLCRAAFAVLAMLLKSVTYRPTLSKFRGVPVKKIPSEMEVAPRYNC